MVQDGPLWQECQQRRNFKGSWQADCSVAVLVAPSVWFLPFCTSVALRKATRDWFATVLYVRRRSLQPWRDVTVCCMDMNRNYISPAPLNGGRQYEILSKSVQIFHISSVIKASHSVALNCRPIGGPSTWMGK